MERTSMDKRRRALRFGAVAFILVMASLLAVMPFKTAYADELESANSQAVSSLESAGKKVVQVSFGPDHSAAVTSDGSLYTWGYNLYGELGYESDEELEGLEISSTPKKCMNEIASVSLGQNRTFAVTRDGVLYAWGCSAPFDEYWSGSWGSLGDGSTVHQAAPVRIMEDVLFVDAGEHHAFAILEDGSLYAWGYNKYGQLGDGTTENSLVPIKIMDDVVAASAGVHHSAAVTSDGSLYVWGLNDNGQLGDGTVQPCSTPKKIADGVVSVDLGGHTSSYIDADGSLWIWGRGLFGVLGNGAVDDCLTPQRVLDNVLSASIGGSCAAVKTDGSLWTWGMNGIEGNWTLGYESEELLGRTHYSSTPREAFKGLIDNPVVVDDGSGRFAVLDSAGNLYTWGACGGGALGNGSLDFCRAPTLIMGPAVDAPPAIEWSTSETSVAYGAVFSRMASASDGSTVVYSSSDGSVAVVSDDGEVTPRGVGTCTITATTERGDASSSYDLTVTPAVLTAVYEGESIPWNEKPMLSLEVTGFVTGENPSNASGYSAPTVSMPDKLVPGGSYELTPSGGSADNYVFEYVAGTLSVGDVAFVDAPKAAEGLVYDGSEQVGVNAGEGYLLTGASAGHAGEYVATAALEEGYAWSDGTTDSKEVAWSIAPTTLTASNVTLSYVTAAYSGSAKKPAATAKVNGVTQLKSEYTVTYWNKAKSKQVSPVNVGTYWVKVAAKDSANTTGAVWKKLTINPKATANLKLTKLNNGFKATWTKRTVQCSGYQVAYKQVGTTAWKHKTVTGYKTNVKSVTGLKDKKSYQVKVRTYKTVNGVKYYSVYTPVKTVKTK